jgi:hypothetical protein
VLSRESLEARFVVLHLRIVCEGCAQFVEDYGDVVVGWLREAIVRPFAVAAGGDEAGAAKICEVTGDFGLVGVQNRNAGTDAEFVVAQQVDQAQARRVSESFEESFHPHRCDLRCSRRGSSLAAEG